MTAKSIQLDARSMQPSEQTMKNVQELAGVFLPAKKPSKDQIFQFLAPLVDNLLTVETAEDQAQIIEDTIHSTYAKPIVNVIVQSEVDPLHYLDNLVTSIQGGRVILNPTNENRLLYVPKQQIRKSHFQFCSRLLQVVIEQLGEIDES